MNGTLWGAAASVLLVLLFQFTGFALARRFAGDSPLPPGERLLLGSAGGSLLMHWLPVLFAFPLRFGMGAQLLAAGTAALLAGFALMTGKRPSRKEAAGFLNRELAGFRQGLFPWVILLVWGGWCFLVFKGFLWQQGAVFSSQATYGDMSMHLTFITSLARQGSFPPEYSLLPGTRLSYPFLSDSISSSLLIFGAPLAFAYELPMFLAGLQVFFGFYLLARRLLDGARHRAALVWMLFFFNGGLGFLYFLPGSGRDLHTLFTAFYETPTNLTEQHIRWVNIIVDMLLPQRATLFGWVQLFAGLILLLRGMEGRGKRAFLFAGGFFGLLPMIHTHSFLAAGLVCAVWVTAELIKKLRLERPGELLCRALPPVGLAAMALLQKVLPSGEDEPALLRFVLIAAGAYLLGLALLLVLVIRREGVLPLWESWGLLLAVTLCLALPQLCIWTFRQAGGFVRGHFGWVIGEENYLLFYLKNFGLAGILALGGLLLPKKGAAWKTAPALLIWFIAEFAVFQPNDYDNNKLLYVGWALLCCGAAEFAGGLLQKIRETRPRQLAAGAAVLMCSLSALLTIGREWVARYELFGTGALDLARYVDSALPADAVILTDTRHNNEIAALTGRNIVCGSPAYLYFHGLDYYENEEAARRMYESPALAREDYRRLGVDYVLVSDFERSSYEVREEEIARLFPLVWEDGSRRLYRVTEGGEGS